LDSWNGIYLFIYIFYTSKGNFTARRKKEHGPDTHGLGQGWNGIFVSLDEVPIALLISGLH